jgi:hypothetical protein
MTQAETLDTVILAMRAAVYRRPRMDDVLTRVVDGVRERLCWCFAIQGRTDPTYEPARAERGPFDPDRRRCLKRGETFQRLDRSGRPRTYQGLSWQPADAIQVEHVDGASAPAVPGEGVAARPSSS